MIYIQNEINWSRPSLLIYNINGVTFWVYVFVANLNSKDGIIWSSKFVHTIIKINNNNTTKQLQISRPRRST